jgi:peptidyl-prolyl cis-trans isomerase A (cyclophilin A)
MASMSMRTAVLSAEILQGKTGKTDLLDTGVLATVKFTSLELHFTTSFVKFSVRTRQFKLIIFGMAMKFLIHRWLLAVVASTLAACGGGGSDTGIAAGDTQIPVATALSAQSVVGNVVTLAATATDNVGVTGYCFKTTSTTPSASDACFQASAQKTGVTLAAGTTNYVWARDAAGNISAALSGPCSISGYVASNSSSKNTVCMMTDKGEFVLELDATKAPITVANFLQYVNTGFYSATAFHRILSTFMIQGGGYTYASGSYSAKSTSAPIQLENKTVTTLSNVRGSIAMARTLSPNTATSQFFINVVDNLGLDGVTATDGYAVFGKVISGLDVVDQIKQVAVQSNGASEVSLPVAPLLIQWSYQIK